MFSNHYQAVMERMLQQPMEEPINLKDFLREYKDLIKKTSSNFNIEELNLDEEALEKIKQNCSLDLIEQPDDAPIHEFIPGSDYVRRATITESLQNVSNLKFVEKMIEQKQKQPFNPFKKTAESFTLLPVPEIREENPTLVDFFNDLVVTVRFYRPAQVLHLGKKLKKPFFLQEIVCLGSNLLTELRDQISCYCNKNIFFDISDNPDDRLPEKTKDPGFFFIYDTFYNDRRNPENPDYSETIIEWAKEAPGLQKIKFKTKNMEETKFLDLNVSLGFPYLYLHHGNCEHIFTFSQIEVVSPSSTCHFKEQYPRIRSKNLYNTRKCCLCGIRPFVYVVEGSLKQIMNPSYVCGNCLHSYYYIDGKKVDNFELYRICETVEKISDSDEDEKDNSDEEEQSSDTVDIKQSFDTEMNET